MTTITDSPAENKECSICEKKEVVFDGTDECGRLNYYCKNCGEPQND